MSSPAKSCDDGDTCTLDSCNSTVVGGCVNTPRTDLVAFCPVVTCKTATGCTASQCTYTNRTDLACQCLLNPCSNRTFCSDSTGSCMTSVADCNTIPDLGVRAQCISSVNASSNPIRFCYDRPTNVCGSGNACFRPICNYKVAFSVDGNLHQRTYSVRAQCIS